MPTNRHFKDIKTCFCFLDETGLLYSKRDKFFALGIIKCRNPQNLYNQIRKIRQKYNYDNEIKWASLDRRIRFDIAREFFNVFLSEDAKFNCIILNKEELDFQKYFQGNLYKVYQNFSVALLKLVIGKDPEEVVILLADDYFTPDGTELEDRIKKFVNDHYQKFIVAGVCQINSKSSDILQLTDLMLGAILYDLKKQHGLIGDQNTYKRKFLNFLYQKLKIKKSFFVNQFGFKTRNYVLSGDKIKATIFDSKRSKAQKFIDKIKTSHGP
ncbi:hypothetical protein COW96_03135 [Candidatus Roizmanbacteria bacterium CG22_combo_CG10-13_8_21_14_all_33_16]|uniref:DUF3800 domain-containing protein n=1 Tax=Candidatus Roizmanbacteria bacterium CG22_combo_CG10-13_8_21_14_all_33_16 TaxID=1974859 RepID=A0A2H0C344_9BACT|nr:MAG: hypothetical protein COW96_03135 [Candidatus Roizmanbacteria bacterium CG22_combo_CG10-13_8_21_14_all_33_16]